ncbi:MAG: PHP domain-containing protein [Acidobacteria bacterium]|nr:PHP domain-containing protein [Acidobacteriota bacterium]
MLRRLLTYVALCCALGATANAQTFERTLHVAPLGADSERYVYVPFEVPRGAARVRVSYEYPRASGANTIDIGLFDARGFRGWSGGRRAEFSVSQAEATPGYLAGALPAGRWRVILGLYKVAPAGVDVKVGISVETGKAVPGPRAPRTSSGSINLPRETAGGRPRWFAGDLHTHTVHSDGEWTVQGLAAAARAAGLDFIFVTDHNTSSHHADVDEANAASRQTLVLRGEEVTTYGGHANAWGLPAGGWVDFRVRPGDAAAMRTVAASAHRLGALISANHPAALCGGCSWSYREALKEFDAFEVWNGEWDATDEAALKMWDGLLQRGLRLTAVASSDTHREQNPVGRPTTHVSAGGLTQASLLDGIRRGRVYLTGEPQGVRLNFEAAPGALGLRAAAEARTGIGGEIRLSAPGTLIFFVRVGRAPVNTAAQLPPPYTSSGLTASLVSGGQTVRTWSPDALAETFEVACERDGYYRLEVRDREGKMVALTNPVYVKVGGPRRPRGFRARGGRVSSRPL